MSTPLSPARLALTRRLWLAGAAGVALTAQGRMAWGATQSDRPKLVVIIARGPQPGRSRVWRLWRGLPLLPLRARR